jgi:ribulose-phosphate 3-epimerase
VPELRIAPSILAADFARLGDEVADVAPAVSMLHVDVMDGHYVPNLSLGQPVVRSLRQASDAYFDLHLMIEDPRTYAPQFLALGAESVTFHPEVEDDPRSLIDLLHELGGEVGVALAPALPFSAIEELLPHVDQVLVMTVVPGFGGQAFMPEVLPKVTQAHAWREEHGAAFRIQVDGGIAIDTIEAAARAGADTFVAGSSVFGAADRVAPARQLLEAARGAYHLGAPEAAR